jgi:uncharacterized phage-associated protein
MNKVLDVARYVINYAIEKSHPISNLQLQKILYYIQAYFLVEKGEVCFKENIINWVYGPVIVEVYDEYRFYGPNKIDDIQKTYTDVSFNCKSSKIEIKQKEFLDNIIKNEDKALIDKVVDKYMEWSPFKLVAKTHEENPWKCTRQNDIISVQSIKDFYVKNKNKILEE